MDSIILFPPGPSVAGSQLQLGTYLMWDPGADYGAQGLIQSVESSNALRDGGVFGFRSVGPRKMAFPLLLRDVPGQTLLQTESLLRNWTTAGAAVAVQPETTPSGQAVFFDVIDGRWEPDYDGYLNRAGWRKGTLFLDTQPWGYWPTEILLASAASQGFMGNLPINAAASLIGDVPPLAHISIIPTVGSNYTGSAGVDIAALSLAGRPSFNPFIPAASFVAASTNTMPASLAGDKYAPASQALVWSPTNGAASQWFVFAQAGSAISSALEPAYRGRFRVFAFAKMSPSSAVPFYSVVDAERTTGSIFGALASGNQLATIFSVAPSVLTNFGIGVYSPSPAYLTLDMGEITLPPSGSGVQQGLRLRWWGNLPTLPVVPSTQVFFGGLYLLPIDGAAGILTAGMFTPSITQVGTQGGAEWNRNFTNSVLGVATPGVAYRDLRSFYRGVTPQLGASTNSLTFLTADRAVLPVVTPIQGNFEYSQVSVSYRPTFQFLRGI